MEEESKEITFEEYINEIATQLRNNKFDFLLDPGIEINICAYLSIIDDEINENIRKYLGLPSLTFIPPKDWDRTYDSINLQLLMRMKPILLEAEYFLDENLSKKYFPFLIQEKEDRAAYIPRIEAINEIAKLDDSYFDFEPSTEIIPNVRKLYMNVINTTMELWEVVNVFKQSATNVREVFFLTMLEVILHDALVNSGSQIQLPERIEQLGLIAGIFIFPRLRFVRTNLGFSNRIITSSDIFNKYNRIRGLPNSNVIEHIHSVKNTPIAIPVARYQGSSGSFYVIGDDDSGYDETSICGTFYYFEPESKVFLLTTSVLVAMNKIHAAAMLGMTMEEIREFLPEEDLADQQTLKLSMAGYQVSTSFFSFNSYLDQNICNLARNQGYDLVVFRELAGKGGNLTEILDTRIRSKGFRNLVLVKNLD